jgi:murein DD-endopeptidase MepM/ murein hydrolase activator NlpD
MGGLVPAVAAGAATSDELDAARQQLTTARSAANETAAAFSDADHDLERTRSEITRLETSIVATKARAAELREFARQRAVFAYTNPSGSLEAFIDATDAVDAARRQRLLDQANQTDSDVAKKLAALNRQLATQQGHLERREREQAKISAELDAKLAALEANQRVVEQAVATLQDRLDAEIAVVQFVDAARQAELERERTALTVQQTISTGGPGQIIEAPVTGAIQCPVAGAAYSNDYTGPGGHSGIDMFVPNGTAAVAVLAGQVTFVPNEGAGGNTAYLAAEDGNTYFYAHFAQFIGGARTVGRGEVIGLTGMTGRTSAPHLHFEIRIGGANGYRSNPYPTLKAAGC